MIRLSPASKVVSFLKRSAQRRGAPGILTLCACLALMAAPGLADEGPTGRREIRLPQLSVPAPGPGLTVKVATREAGIEGEIREAGLSLLFKSQTVKKSLTATITRSDGTVLYDYREFGGETITLRGKDGARIVLSKTPELRVQGVLYGPSTPEQLAALRTLATSREGALIRRLGLELYLATPGRELVDERRGLELATQALWPHFPPGGASVAPLTVDYEVGEHGYLVLTQPDDLVLATNHLRTNRLLEKHDDHQVNDCFGRCGEGCTGGFLGVQIYPSHWTDTYGTPIPYSQEVHCVTGEDWVYSFYRVPTTHSVTGLWTPGCQLHDNCCRLNTLLCWTYCNSLVLLTAEDILLDPNREVRTWTYTDYQWSITSYNAGYSGCTCPGMSPYLDDYECIE
jgi:hypothetical protein